MKKSDKLRNYFNKNPELLVCPEDKNKDIVIYTTTQYEEKIGTVLLGPEFEKLVENPFDNDIKEFYSEIALFEDYFDEKTMGKLDPNHELKKFYAEVKTHKPDWPIRPIISSINSITIGI